MKIAKRGIRLCALQHCRATGQDGEGQEEQRGRLCGGEHHSTRANQHAFSSIIIILALYRTPSIVLLADGLHLRRPHTHNPRLLAKPCAMRGRYSHLLSAFSSRSQELQRSDDFQIPSTSEKTSLVSLCFTSLLSSSLARMRLGVHCRIHRPPPLTPRLVACFAPPHTSTTPSYHLEECHGACRGGLGHVRRV